MMPNLSISENNKFILCVPYAYTFFSRTKSVRDFVVNAATSWVPAYILILLLTKIGLSSSALAFVVGYLMFLCVYEVGYLANDSYGLLHDSTPRDRLQVRPTKAFVATFIVIRVILFLLCSAFFEILDEWLLWFAYLALGSVLVLHNTIKQLEFKFFSFFQLSMLRYSLPVLPALIADGRIEFFSLVLLLGALTFTLPRFLTYLDAKGRLELPERKQQKFLLFALIVVLPGVLVISAIYQHLAPFVVLSWLIVVQVVYNVLRPEW